MAKRYGRNQRRKHREQIGTLTDYLRVAIDRKVEQERRADALERRIADWATRINRVCGEDHPFNERVIARVVSSLTPYYRHAPRPRLSFDALMSAEPQDVAFRYIDLIAHEIEARDEAPAGVPTASVVLHTPSGRSAFYADRAHLARARRDPEFERYVARRLIDELDKADC